MSKKILFGFSLVVVFTLLAGVSSVNASSDKGKEAGEQHRSDVAEVVKKLEKIADEDNKIETEVEDVVEEEKKASEKVKEKMSAVDERGGFKTFLIGSDYKNLGELRSELVTTDNSLNRLNRALEKTTDDSIKADLQAQINELSEIKSEAEDFVKSIEGKFSLFGWLARMFQ